MKNVEVVCDACEARMRLSEGLLERIAGKTGRITCKQCANKIALDAKGDALRVTEGGSLLAVDLEVEELDEAPHSGLDLIDPAFSEFPAEIKMKEEDHPHPFAEPTRGVPAGVTSIPPPLPSDLQEKRRQSIAAKMEAPVPEGSRQDEDSLTPHSLGEDDLPELEHAPPSTPFASERDETFRSLYPKEKEPEPQLAPAFSRAPSPPHKSSHEVGSAPLAPGAVVLGSDGKLHNLAELGGSGAGGSTWLPWTVAAVSLLALGVSLTAQVSGDFRQTLTSRADDPDSSMMNYGETDPAALRAGGLKELATVVQENIVEEVPPVEDGSVPTPPVSPVQTKEKRLSGAAIPATKLAATTKTNPPDAQETTAAEEPEQDIADPNEEKETTMNEEPEPLFNQAAASTSLTEAGAQAQSCRRPGDPAGKATVLVTFAASGRVTQALVTGLHFAGTPLGGCIASRFRSATVPAFGGEPVTLTRVVNIQ